MALILTYADTDYNDIRRLVSENLTADDLTNTQIGSNVFLELAESDILSRRSLTSKAAFDLLSAVDKLKVMAAIKYRTAALLIPSTDSLVGETADGRAVRMEEKNWEERVKMYNMQADTHVPPAGGQTGSQRVTFELL